MDILFHSRVQAAIGADVIDLMDSLYIPRAILAGYDWGDRGACAFENDDYIDIVIHSYRHRLSLAPGYAPHDDVEKRLADQPPITVPTITLDGQADGNFPGDQGESRVVSLPSERGYQSHRGGVSTTK